MTSVRLDRALETRLKRVAEITGKTVSRVIQEAVEKHCDDVLRTETLDVALAGYIGSLHSTEPTDASKSQEVFGEILEEKRRTGHL
jgi:predicted DNA-binding ribbon-helix-helix protein